MRWLKDRWPQACAILSGALLSASFAPLETSEAAWIALIPLLLACRFADERHSVFRLGFLAGSVFWLTSIWWLVHVSWAGWITLAFYCALYVGAFAWFAARWFRKFGHLNWAGNLAGMFLMACAWAGLEWVRGTFATGFPWNPLGVSLYRNPALLQAAAWGGAYAVSALVVWVNAGIAFTAARYIERGGHWGRRPHVELMLAFLVLALAFWGGVRRVRAMEPGPSELRVGLVQTAIPQDDKWDSNTVDLIYRRLDELTTGVKRTGPLHLIIWPETALPDDVRYSQASYDLVYKLCELGTPILVGSMDSEWPEKEPPRYFNSSFLFDIDGKVIGSYEKQHLVPFGEYIPLQKILPFIKAMTPIQESFTAGTNAAIFSLDEPAVDFSVLICFEDTIPRLARNAVRAGARLLVNQTNDAWFDPSSASRQHRAHCVLRVVETGVPAVRAANTGVSCYINRRGVIAAELVDGRGNTIFPGFKSIGVWPAPAQLTHTFYVRYGDVLPMGAAGIALLAALGMRIRAGQPTP